MKSLEQSELGAVNSVFHVPVVVFISLLVWIKNTFTESSNRKMNLLKCRPKTVTVKQLSRTTEKNNFRVATGMGSGTFMIIFRKV